MSNNRVHSSQFQGSCCSNPLSIRCSCELQSLLLTVKKNGPTKGLKFFRYPNWKVQSEDCGYFVWENNFVYAEFECLKRENRELISICEVLREEKKMAEDRLCKVKMMKGKLEEKTKAASKGEMTALGALGMSWVLFAIVLCVLVCRN